MYSKDVYQPIVKKKQFSISLKCVIFYQVPNISDGLRNLITFLAIFEGSSLREIIKKYYEIYEYGNYFLLEGSLFITKDLCI